MSEVGSDWDVLFNKLWLWMLLVDCLLQIQLLAVAVSVVSCLQRDVLLLQKVKCLLLFMFPVLLKAVSMLFKTSRKG